MSNRPISRPDEIVSVGDELTLLVIRVDPNERRIGLSLKELHHAIAVEPPKDWDERGKGGRRGSGKRGKHREDYEDDDD
jgi:ribosomal protein S1